MENRLCMYCKRDDREHYFVVSRFDEDSMAVYDAYLCHFCFVGNEAWDNTIVKDERNCYTGMREGMPIIDRLKAWCTRTLKKDRAHKQARFHALRLMLMYGDNLAQLITLEVGKPSLVIIRASMEGRTAQALCPSSC